jgi:hypothetical protein
MPKRTKRRNTRRRVSKKNKTKRRKKTKRIRRKMRGGSAKFRAKGWTESRRRNRKALNLNPDAADAELVEQVSLNEAETTDNPLFMNILNKFFKEVDGWFGSKSYELDPTKLGPNHKINVISSHGHPAPETFFIIPEGLTLYLPVAAGDQHTTLWIYHHLLPLYDDEHKNSYIRVYEEGSLIQDQNINFRPFYGDRAYRGRGLLELDVPHLSVKNATEANKELINFLARQAKLTSADQRTDRIDKEESGDTDIHLKTYEDVYFGNNIDGIIDKNDLILSATKQKQYYLSGILRLIAEARKKNPSISGVWFGTFCRSGDFADITKFMDCNEQELPELPEGFFQGDFHYEGISDELVRQASLASNASTINFKKILEGVFEKREQYDDDDFKESFKERIEGIKQSVDNNEVISLTDVCFVFQMKQKYP